MDRLSKIALGRFYFSPIFVQKIAVVFAYFSMWSIWNLEKATKFVQLDLDPYSKGNFETWVFR